MLRDKIGRAMLVVCAIGALGAFATGLGMMQTAGPERLWLEAWRTFGFLVFAGMFALLAWRPRSSPGIWELVFAHKLAMSVFALFAGAIAEAALAGKVDFALVLLIVLSWWLCRGWDSWSRTA